MVSFRNTVENPEQKGHGASKPDVCFELSEGATAAFEPLEMDHCGAMGLGLKFGGKPGQPVIRRSSRGENQPFDSS